MSQIASFTYLKESEIPHLGFWSKPKRRIFREPENKFSEFLQRHRLRELVFDEADGVYVALVFALIQSRDGTFGSRMDPVIETVRKRVTGSHWLVKSSDPVLMPLLEKALPEGAWPAFLRSLGEDGSNYQLFSFEKAWRYVAERLSELGAGEALLVSVG